MSEDAPTAVRVTVDDVYEVTGTLNVLRLQPGDLLVLVVKHCLTTDQKEGVHNVLTRALAKAGLNAPCLVLDEGMQFDVIRGALEGAGRS